MLILLGAFFFPSVYAQVPDNAALVVEFQHKTFYAEPGVTAAYSLDPAVAQASAVPGGFEIAGMASTTDSKGRYLFRHLSPGTITIGCEYQGKQYTRTVSLAPSPDIETGINITLPLTGLAANPALNPPTSNGSANEPGDAQFQNQRHSPRPRK